MYKAGVTLDEMSGGRFTLGVGTGWLQDEHDAFGLELWEMGERFDRLTDALGYLRTAVDGDDGGHDGPFYRLEPFAPQPVPDRLRLLVGGSGPRRTPELAGRFADEFNVVGGGETDLGTKVQRARDAAAAAGRDPDALFCSTAFPPVVAADEAELDERMREMAERRGIDVDRLAGHLSSSGIPFGTPEMLADRMTALRDAGVRRIYLQVAFLELEEIAKIVDLVERALDS
jgi:alkanesulfonate monooxygenase SsuD/methylene tetrahydromethanopterin reductase-like flavin-dependent oxidoreductase (luciferase family)